MTVSRRALLLGAGAAAAGVWSPSNAGASGHNLAFENPLRIPSLLPGELRDGVRTYELSAEHGRMSFLPGLSTETIGFNGAYLGPTIRCKSGDRVKIKLQNNLREAAAVHWHGLLLPARMDGGPHQAVAPGATWVPEFEIRQRGSLCWYHAHTLHQTGRQVLRGLAGLMLIDDDDNRAAGLPSDYGVDDIPLVLQDRRFRRDGSFEYMTSMHDMMMGYTGDVLLVNGTVRPVLSLQRPRTRLRVLNGSNSRIYTLGRSDGVDLTLIATDGGLLEAPVSMPRVRVAPGERVEFLVEPRDGKTFRLMSYPDDAGGSMGGMMGMRGNDETFVVLELRAASPAGASVPIPAKLSTLHRLKTEDSTATRRFTLDMGMMGGMMGPRMGPMGGMMAINGLAMDMRRIDFRVPVGNIEVWEILNRTPLAHPFHIHNTQFGILDRDGEAPGAHERGLKDTVLVDPGARVRLIMQFKDFADPQHPYMYHCHILEHEDGGMMGQFVVV